MKRNIKLCALAILLCAAMTLPLAGCPKALMPSILDYSDDDFATLCGKIFDKDYKRVTAEDMASIESFSILTYGEDNTVTVGFTGFIDAPTDKNQKTVDITGLVFDNFNDFVYLTGLREFSSTYTTNNDYSFLANCKELEKIMIAGNSECRDYEFLRVLPKVHTFSLESGVIDDISVISSMTNLKNLSLTSVTTKIDPDYLMSTEGITIEELGYDEHAILEISFLEGLTNLEKLTISSASVRELDPLAGLQKLTYLDLSYNAIDDITPIAQLKNLEYLDLTQSIISDVSPLASLDKDKIQRIILDLCYSIDDWSPLDAFEPSKIQGRNAQY